MKLYVVDFTFTAVIAAEDEDDAFHAAFSDFREIARDQRSTEISIDIIKEVASPSDLPENWNADCLPYSGDGDQRIKDYLRKPK